MLIILFPFYWMLVSSLKTALELMTTYDPIPHTFTLSNYEGILFMTPFIRYLGNSVLLALTATTISTVLSCLAAFSILRFRYKGRSLFMGLIVLAYMFQGFFLVIPLAQIMAYLHLYNTVIGLAILHSVLAIPFCTYILMSFFDTIPVEVEESALIDGCTRLGAFLRVTLPLSVSGLATAAIFAFILSWNEYTFAYVMLVGETFRTVPLGLSETIAHYAVDWGTLLAGSVLVTIPGFVVFLLIGKYIQKGLVTGAVKA